LVSELLTREQLDEALAILRASGNPDQAEVVPGDELLAQKLVELGRLNVWQAKQLLDGRTKFTLGPYRIIDSLGVGGMGQVFKGEHGMLGRIVAIKVLPLAKSTPEAVASFMQEIRNQAMLDHVNLVRALDAGSDGNVYYLVTEYVPGADLRKLVRRSGPLNMASAASIVAQVAAGLQYAHDQGLIHRDVKPGNVLVTPEGHAKLSDLGLSGSLRGDASEDPRFGKIVGTADYLSPDHIAAPWKPKPAWDIYSLGCTLYYAVTGKVPFPFASTTAEKAKAHCELQPLDPRLLNPTLAPAFVDVIADMMCKDPTRRVATAAGVAARLTAWFDEAGGLGRSQPSRHWSQAGSAAPIPGAADESELQDTQPSLPSLTPSSPERRPSPGNGQPAGALTPTANPLPVAEPVPEPPLVVWRPLLVFVLLPLGLISLLFLIWWGVRLLF
jgi:serine/threonine protein kinase